MVDKLLSTYPLRTLSYVLGHDSGGLVGKMDATALGGGPGGTGDVVGPASAIADRIAVYNGTTGKLIKDGGVTIAGLQPLITPASLTTNNDANVTLTSGGASSTALLQAMSLSMGWNGTLGVARGGTNISSYAVGDLLYASGATTLGKLTDVATGNALISGGVGVAPSWGKIGLATHVTGSLPDANLATMGVYSLKGNNTGSVAIPADVSIPGLSVKGTPTTSDFLLLSDAAASGQLKRIAWTSTGGALDADLAAIAALTGTGYARRTAPDTWILDTPAGSGTPGGSATQLQYNTGSGFGGVTGSAVDGAGAMSLVGPLTLTQSSAINAPVLRSAASTSTGFGFAFSNWAFVVSNTTVHMVWAAGKAMMRSDVALGWASGSDPSGDAIDVNLYRQGAGVLAQSNAANAQAFRVYKTTDNNTTPGVYERGTFDWTTTANTLTIGAQMAGGTLRPLNLVGSALTFNGSPIVGGPGGGGAVVSATPPAFTGDGQLWWENDTGAFHVEYSSAWVAVTPVPAALTKINDTNVTLTLGGTPGTALQQPVSLTLGWAGTLAATRGGTNQASYTSGDMLFADSSATLAKLALAAAGSALLSGTVPSWGKIGNTHLATAAAFTLKANNTAGVAAPTDVSITGLAVKGTPTVSDFVLISDTGAAGELKKIAWTAGGGSGSPGGALGSIQYNNTTFGGFGSYSSNTLRVANGANAQILNVYRQTDSDTTPLEAEWFAIDWQVGGAGGVYLYPDAVGATSVRRDLWIGGHPSLSSASKTIIRAGNSGTVTIQGGGPAQLHCGSVAVNGWNIDGAGHLVPFNTNERDIGMSAYKPRTVYQYTTAFHPVAYAALPAAPTEGMLACVTDAAVNTFGAVVSAGSGGNHVLARYNGTNWTVCGI